MTGAPRPGRGTPARLPVILAGIGLMEAESEVAMGLDLRSLPNDAPAGPSHAILQAAEAGVGVYERLGFRGFGTVTEWKPPNGAGRV